MTAPKTVPITIVEFDEGDQAFAPSRSRSSTRSEDPRTLKFHGGSKSTWGAIDRIPSRSGQIIAAIGYLNDAAALPFKRGDILITDLTPAAIKSGSANPQAAIPLLRAGVDVRSRGNLHAKVILTPGKLIVGSMNASKRSRDYLIEAAIETSDRRLRQRAAAWLSLLTAESRPVTRQLLGKLLKLKRPAPGPKPDAEKPGPETGDIQESHNTWLTFSYLGNWQEAADAEAVIKAASQEAKFKNYRLEAFEGALRDDKTIARGDLIISAELENGEWMVYVRNPRERTGD